jgi:putative SOS response-associated peptidase YedK
VRALDLSVPGNLSRVSWKLSRTVLRGGTNSNVGPLLGRRIGTSKQPFCFEVNEGDLFAFAGLWDGWKDPRGQWIRSCSILTTTPNAVTSQVHDRMPVILNRDDYNSWLDHGMTKVEEIADLLKPFNARLMRAYPVSSRINHVHNDDADCARPIGIESAPRSQLFL